MTSWIERDIEIARRALDIKVANPSLGFVANLELGDPGIRERINDEGFDARVQGVPLDLNPYFRDGEYEWWRNGWFAADSSAQKS